jgi:TPR repeat protein
MKSLQKSGLVALTALFAVAWTAEMSAGVQAATLAGTLAGVSTEAASEASAKKPPKEDIATLRPKAEAGDAAAQTEMGDRYFMGRFGVDKDRAEGVRWYRLAAEQGYAEAQNALGAVYAQGLGVERNTAEAVKWLRKAAAQGNPYSKNRLLGMGYSLEEDASTAPQSDAQIVRRGLFGAVMSMEAASEGASSPSTASAATAVASSAATTQATPAAVWKIKFQPEYAETVKTKCAEQGIAVPRHIETGYSDESFSSAADARAWLYRRFASGEYAELYKIGGVGMPEQMPVAQ